MWLHAWTFLVAIVHLSAVAAAIPQFASISSGFHASIALVQNTTTNAQDLYLQLKGPTNASYASLGIGAKMAGALYFVMYPDATANGVTLSVRSASGHHQPRPVTTGINFRVLQQDFQGGSMQGSMVMYNATSWTVPDANGSVSTKGQQPFIWAIGPQIALASNDVGARIHQHEDGYFGSFYADMGAAATSSSAAFPSLGNKNINVMVNPSNTKILVLTHEVLFCLAFFVTMPAGVLFLRLPALPVPGFMERLVAPLRRHAVRLHSSLQTLSGSLVLAGLAVALYFSLASPKFKDLGHGHQILGIVAFCMVALQWTIGMVHHIRFRLGKITKSTRTVGAYSHIWLGRLTLLVGAINTIVGGVYAGDNAVAGGLGVIAAVVIVFTITTVTVASRRIKQGQYKEYVGAGPQADVPIPLALHSRS